MKYTILLWPHANARYRAETQKLAGAELASLKNIFCAQDAVFFALMSGNFRECQKLLLCDKLRRLLMDNVIGYTKRNNSV